MTLQNIERWTRPPYYVGASWPEYYSAGVGQSRDSDALDRSNFDAMLKALRAAESPDGNGKGHESVTVVRESHWAVGWVEWIAIHESDAAALEVADRIRGAMEDYPVIDENLFSEYEDEECATVWEQCFSPEERIHYLRNHSYTCHALADLFQAVREGCWYHAANMLHCPSDLASA